MNQKGQSTIEFALTLMLFLGMSFFFIQLCFVFAWGNYVHYATFMSARTYQAGWAHTNQQETKAEDVLKSMLKNGQRDRFPTFGKSVGEAKIGKDDHYGSDEAHSWLEGVRYRFRSRLFTFPFLKSEEVTKANFVELQSESWLGREPTFDDCRDWMMHKKGGGKVIVIDNGC